MNAPVELFLEQGSQEWRDKRRTTRPASKAGVVMQVSPYEKWEDLADWYLGKEKEISEHQQKIFQHGHDLEPILRKAFSPSMKPTVFQYGDYLASLDGWNGELLEIKAPASGKKSKTWKAAVEGKIEDHYFFQTQQQMYVTGAKKAYFLVGISADEYIVIEVQRDEIAIQKLLDAWDKFFDFLLTYQPKEVDERTDRTWELAALQWQEAKEEADKANERLEVAKKALLTLANATKTHGAGVTVTKSQRPTAIDYATIPQLKGVDLEQYRKTNKDGTKFTNVITISFDKE